MLAFSWLRQLQRRWFPRRPIRRAPVRRVRLHLEPLEDRLTPSTYTVTDASDAAGSANDVTLRFAISQAVSTQDQNAVINFSSTLAGQTITLSQNDTSAANIYGPTAFVVNNAKITIDGSNAPGLVLNGNNALRLLAVTNTASLNTNSPAPVLTHGIMNVEPYSISPTSRQKAGDVPLADCLNDDKLETPFGKGCWRYAGATKGDPVTEVESQFVATNTGSYMQQVMFANGKLWGALGTALQLDSGTQTGIAYFVIQPQVSNGTVSGKVVLQGYLGLENNNLTYPAVGVTSSGRGVIAFTVIGPDYYPSAGYASLDALVGAGDVHIVAEGLGPDDNFSAYTLSGITNYARWGDYGAAAVDKDTIWIASEYIGQTCNYADYLASISLASGCGATRTRLLNWYTRLSKLTP